MSRTALVTGSLLAAAVLAACGGGSKPADRAANGATEPGMPAGVPASRGVPGAPGATGAVDTPVASGSGAAPGGSAAPGASRAPAAPGGTASPTPQPSATQIALDVRLAKSCVRPGETQTVTLEARPHMRVLVNTGYADGKDGTEHGGRFNTDQSTDANGHYSATWTVALTAPQGEASTSVAAVDETSTGHRRVPFRVSVTC